MKYIAPLFVAILLSACQHGASIVFLLPDGYNGLFLVSNDHKNGVDTLIVNGEYTLDIPASGTLAIKSLDIFDRLHKESGQYKNGTVIPSDSISSTTGYSIWALPFVPGTGCFYFVGTPEDYALISKKCDFQKLPLATKIRQSMIDALWN